MHWIMGSILENKTKKRCLSKLHWLRPEKRKYCSIFHARWSREYLNVSLKNIFLVKNTMKMYTTWKRLCDKYMDIDLELHLLNKREHVGMLHLHWLNLWILEFKILWNKTCWIFQNVIVLGVFKDLWICTGKFKSSVLLMDLLPVIC